MATRWENVSMHAFVHDPDERPPPRSPKDFFVGTPCESAVEGYLMKTVPIPASEESGQPTDLKTPSSQAEESSPFCSCSFQQPTSRLGCPGPELSPSRIRFPRLPLLSAAFTPGKPIKRRIREQTTKRRPSRAKTLLSPNLDSLGARGAC